MTFELEAFHGDLIKLNELGLEVTQLKINNICFNVTIRIIDWFGWFGFMVFNATFNNISVISWLSVLLVEEIGGPGENHDLLQVADKLYHIMLYDL
jgi:hypothetical protein